MTSPEDRLPRRDQDAKLALCLGVLLFLCYMIVFWLTVDQSPLRHVRDALVNTAPAMLIGTLMHGVLTPFVWPRRALVQLIVQIPLALLFASSWYLAIILARSLGGNWLTEGISAPPFVYIAFVWQMFQGVTLYAAIALFSLVLHLRRQLAARSADVAAAPGQPDTLLVKVDGELTSLSLSDIISISGAGDYSEITLSRGKRLSTTSLNTFEDRLPPDRFLRVHRSHIIRLSAVEKAEPVGNGRLLILLSSGDTVTASRSGARALRSLSH